MELVPVCWRRSTPAEVAAAMLEDRFGGGGSYRTRPLAEGPAPLPPLPARRLIRMTMAASSRNGPSCAAGPLRVERVSGAMSVRNTPGISS